MVYEGEIGEWGWTRSEVDLNGSLWYTVAFNYVVIIELKAMVFSQIRIFGGY